MKSKDPQFYVLDIGSSKISALACFSDNQGFPHIISSVILSSEGFKSSYITNIKFAEQSLLTAIYSIEKETGKNISSLSVGLSSNATRSSFTSQSLKITSGVVTQKDHDALIFQCLNDFYHNDYEVIDYFILEYITDNNIVTDPVGIPAKEIKCRMHAILASKTAIKGIVTLLNKHHINVSSFFSNIYTASVASLTEDDKQIGCIVIDFGGRNTSFAVFFNGNPIYTGNIPIGGWHITSDIAKYFSISISTAEKLKIMYGNALLNDKQKRDLLNIEDFEHSDAGDNFSVYDLCYVINARLEEIFEMIHAECSKLSVDSLISKKIIITGGSSEINNLKILVGKIFKKQVRIPKVSCKGFTEKHNNSMFANVIGMAKIEAKYFVDNKKASNIIKKIVSWISGS